MTEERTEVVARQIAINAVEIKHVRYDCTAGGTSYSVWFNLQRGQVRVSPAEEQALFRVFDLRNEAATEQAARRFVVRYLGIQF